MRNIARVSISIAAAFVLALGSVTLAAPTAERADKSFMLYGKVLKVDQKARTLLLSERSTKKLYLVNVPEGASIKITFGQCMHYSRPDIQEVFKNDRVALHVRRSDKEHLAQLEEGRQAVLLIAAE